MAGAPETAVPHREIVYTSQQIGQRVVYLARKVAWTYRGKNPLLIPLLDGGARLGEDLADVFRRDLPRFQHEFRPAKISTYGNDREPGQPHFVDGFDMDVEDRDVVGVDDISDGHSTGNFFVQEMLDRGARSAKLLVMLNRITNKNQHALPLKQSQILASGFATSINDWFVGYGMDDKGKGRDLPYIAIAESQPEEIEPSIA